MKGLVAISAIILLIGMAFGADSALGSGSVKIVYPKVGQNVSMVQNLLGTYEGLPPASKIFVVVYVTDISRYYPQDFPILLTNRGRWLSKAIIGNETDTGFEFGLLLVGADGQASAEIESYLAESKRRGSWPGMEKLPSGTVVYSIINTRRGQNILNRT